MKCPRSGSPLKSVKVGPITVEISETSGGVFFDSRELDHFTEPSEIKGKVLTNHLRQFEQNAFDFTARVNCPKCPDTVMMRRYESPAHIVEIDECPSCAGIWLDTGELRLLRDNHLSKTERLLLRERLIRDIEKSPLSQSQAQNMPSLNLNRVYQITENILPW